MWSWCVKIMSCQGLTSHPSKISPTFCDVFCSFSKKFSTLFIFVKLSNTFSTFINLFYFRVSQLWIEDTQDVCWKIFFPFFWAYVCYICIHMCKYALSKYVQENGKVSVSQCFKVVRMFEIKASEMLVAPRISEYFGLLWSAIVCLGLQYCSFFDFF